MVRYSVMMLDMGSKPQLPIRHVIIRANNHAGLMQLFCFSLSMQESINYTKYATLYYKIGLILDAFSKVG